MWGVYRNGNVIAYRGIDVAFWRFCREGWGWRGGGRGGGRRREMGVKADGAYMVSMSAFLLADETKESRISFQNS